MLEHQVAKSFEAMNRRDLEAVMAHWRDDAVFEFPGHTRISGRHEGKAAVREFFATLFDALASMHFTVQHVGFANPVTLTWSNVIYVDWIVDDTARDGRTHHNEGISRMTFRSGKLVEVRDYFFDLAALEAFVNGTPATAAV